MTPRDKEDVVDIPKGFPTLGSSHQPRPLVQTPNSYSPHRSCIPLGQLKLNMSWIGELTGGKAPAPYVADPSEEKVADPNIAGRMVSRKSANQPFLKYVFGYQRFIKYLTKLSS